MEAGGNRGGNLTHHVHCMTLERFDVGVVVGSCCWMDYGEIVVSEPSWKKKMLIKWNNFVIVVIKLIN